MLQGFSSEGRGGGQNGVTNSQKIPSKLIIRVYKGKAQPLQFEAIFSAVFFFPNPFTQKQKIKPDNVTNLARDLKDRQQKNRLSKQEEGRICEATTQVKI